MILHVIDGNGLSQTVIAASQEAVADKSGVIAATGVSQELVAANTLRSGFVVQNRSTLNPMYVNDLGAAGVGGSSFVIPPGGTFPPVGYPITTGAVAITGTNGDLYTAREW